MSMPRSPATSSSLPAPPITLSSPRSPITRSSSPAPPSTSSLPRPPWITSAPGPPQIRSLPRLPRIVSAPFPPQITSRPGVPWITSLPSVPTIFAWRPWQIGVSIVAFSVVAAPATAAKAARAASAARIPIRSFIRRRSGAADQLLVDELVGAEAAELAAEAGALETAERQLGTVRPDQVDVDHSGFDPVGDPLALRLVGGHHVGA